VLTAHEAEAAWKVRIEGTDHPLFTDADFFAKSTDSGSRIWLQSRGSARFEFTITPPLATELKESLPLTHTMASASVERFTAEAAPRDIHIEVQQTQPASATAPVKIGPALSWRPTGVAEAPPETELPQAAKWSITIPPRSMNGLSNVFLKIQYTGDLARLYAGHELLDDEFYNGEPWSIGLSRFIDAPGGAHFELSVLPLRDDAPVYFELSQTLPFPSSGQIVQLEGVEAVLEYQMVLDSAR
jgi:beta-galactosidase